MVPIKCHLFSLNVFENGFNKHCLFLTSLSLFRFLNKKSIQNQRLVVLNHNQV